MSISFDDLRSANDKRQQEWPGNDKADLAFRMIEVSGEAGELAEAVKKRLRDERGIKGTTLGLEDIADEMGDLVVSLDLLAAEMGVKLGDAVMKKFNKTSQKYEMNTRLAPTSDIAEEPNSVRPIVLVTHDEIGTNMVAVDKNTGLAIDGVYDISLVKHLGVVTTELKIRIVDK